jgi:hypothetical protein
VQKIKYGYKQKYSSVEKIVKKFTQKSYSPETFAHIDKNKQKNQFFRHIFVDNFFRTKFYTDSKVA